MNRVLYDIFSIKCLFKILFLYYLKERGFCQSLKNLKLKDSNLPTNIMYTFAGGSKSMPDGQENTDVATDFFFRVQR